MEVIEDGGEQLPRYCHLCHRGPDSPAVYPCGARRRKPGWREMTVVQAFYRHPT